MEAIGWDLSGKQRGLIMGPISKKVIDGLQKAKNRKIINFSEIKAANAYAQDLDKTVVSKDNLSKLTDSLSKADDIYLPSYPPKSPHTQSYFTCWGFFDLCAGIKKESFMKYGKNKHFWNEYIFEGFVNYQADMIMLAGFPDIPLSLPHSEASQRERGEI